MKKDLEYILTMLLPELERSLKENNISAKTLKSSLEERRIDLAGLPELNEVKNEALLHVADETAENKDNKVSFRNLEKSIKELDVTSLKVKGKELMTFNSFDSAMVGAIISFATQDFEDFKPQGCNGVWVYCDGRTFAKESYPLLYNKIGNKFGGVAGSTFGIPNLQGLVTACASSSEPINKTDGVKSSVVKIAELEEHDHNISYPNATFVGPGPGVWLANSGSSGINSSTYTLPVKTGKTGGNTSRSNMQPTMYLAKFIYCA